eukprot:scaffold5695_cov145-Isochrysis_galbana.AAC.2
MIIMIALIASASRSAEDGAESLPRDDRRLLAVMERSSGPPQTTQGACAAAPPLVDLAPSPPGFAPTVFF